MTMAGGGRYKIVYADPPWQYNDRNPEGAAERHYRTMPTREICALPVAALAAPDAVLFMWATWPLLRDAFTVMEAWGFTYKTAGFLWVKENRGAQARLFRTDNDFFFGLGRWTRGNTEPCLLAVRGDIRRTAANVGQLVLAPLRRHSEKPAEVRDRIVALMGDLPRVELFARTRAAGWDAFGNEVAGSIGL